MNIKDLAKTLSQIDDPEEWANHIPSLYSAVFELAEPLWVQRMIKQDKLYVHPNVIKQLRTQSFKSTDLQ